MKSTKWVIVLALVLLFTGCTAWNSASTEPPSEALRPASSEVDSSSSAGEERSSSEAVERTELWELLLVNTKNLIAADYAPPVLEKFRGGRELDARIVPAMEQMFAAAAVDGVELVLLSAYRTYDYQQQIFDRKVEELKAKGYDEKQAHDYTKLLIALPGTSEHQTGLAADIVTPTHYDLTEAYAQTDAAKWLAANAATYGFILRYPKDKTEITGISFEPWHYRYVGIASAQEIMAAEICLEEYLEVD